MPRVTANKKSFDEAMLFTHRGLSGPGDPPDLELLARGRRHRHRPASRHRRPRRLLRRPGAETPKLALQTVLASHLPKRLAPDAGRRDRHPRHDRRHVRQDASTRGRGRAAPLDHQAHRLRRLPHRRSHAGRRRHRRPRLHHHGGPHRARPLLHRRSASTSPAGSAATTSSGPGPAAGPPARWRSIAHQSSPSPSSDKPQEPPGQQHRRP